MRYLLLTALCLALTAGCSRTPPQVRVQGQVLVNGRPLRGGTVVFAPDEKRGARGPVSVAVIDNEGAFDLASERGPGTVSGWHRITVAPAPESTDLIAGLERYRHPELSGLEFQVKEGQPNNVTLTLEWNR